MSVPPYGQAPGTGDQPEGQPVQPGPQPPPAYGQPPYGQPGAPGEPGAYEQSRGYAEQGYPPPQQQGYGPPYGFQPQTEQKAIWALVAALAGYVACPIVLHVVGWVLANQALRDIRARREAIAREYARQQGEDEGGIGIYTGYGDR